MEILFDENTGLFFMGGIRICRRADLHLVQSAGLKLVDTYIPEEKQNIAALENTSSGKKNFPGDAF